MSRRRDAKIALGRPGAALSKESRPREPDRERIGAAWKGKKRPPFTDEHKAKIGAAAIGRKLSLEHRAKISAGVRSLGTEWRYSLRKAHENMTKETRLAWRKRLSISKLGNKNCVGRQNHTVNHTLEARSKISEKLKGKPWTEKRREAHDLRQTKRWFLSSLFAALDSSYERRI